MIGSKIRSLCLSFSSIQVGSMRFIRLKVPGSWSDKAPSIGGQLAWVRTLLFSCFRQTTLWPWKIPTLIKLDKTRIYFGPVRHKSQGILAHPEKEEVCRHSYHHCSRSFQYLLCHPKGPWSPIHRNLQHKIWKRDHCGKDTTRAKLSQTSHGKDTTRSQKFSQTFLV